MALQIRVQQMIRDHRRFIFGTTTGTNHGMHQAAQRGGINTKHRGGFHGHSPGVIAVLKLARVMALPS
jgi:hypothetical protein